MTSVENSDRIPFVAAENKRNSLNVTALKDFSLMKKQRKFKKKNKKVLDK